MDQISTQVVTVYRRIDALPSLTVVCSIHSLFQLKSPLSRFVSMAAVITLDLREIHMREKNRSYANGDFPEKDLMYVLYCRKSRESKKVRRL